VALTLPSASDAHCPCESSTKPGTHIPRPLERRSSARNPECLAGRWYEHLACRRAWVGCPSYIAQYAVAPGSAVNGSFLSSTKYAGGGPSPACAIVTGTATSVARERIAARATARKRNAFNWRLESPALEGRAGSNRQALGERVLPGAVRSQASSPSSGLVVGYGRGGVRDGLAPGGPDDVRALPPGQPSRREIL
jgi:hypothetical protein